MIGQYLPQTNESATVAKIQIFLHLNKALGGVWDCFTNSTVEQLHKKLKLWSTSLGALTTPPFFLELSAWSWNRLAKKREAELKNLEQSSPKHPLSLSRDLEENVRSIMPHKCAETHRYSSQK